MLPLLMDNAVAVRVLPCKCCCPAAVAGPCLAELSSELSVIACQFVAICCLYAVVKVSRQTGMRFVSAVHQSAS